MVAVGSEYEQGNGSSSAHQEIIEQQLRRFFGYQNSDLAPRLVISNKP
jgi:hypothetical protein